MKVLFLQTYKTIGLVIALILSIPAVSFARDFSGPVVSVLDGDTIEVLHHSRAVRIRLNGIDCPEKGQAYGKRASLHHWPGLKREGQRIRPRGTMTDPNILA